MVSAQFQRAGLPRLAAILSPLTIRPKVHEIQIDRLALKVRGRTGDVTCWSLRVPCAECGGSALVCVGILW